MKYSFLLVSLLFLFACGQQPVKETPVADSNTVTQAPVEVSPAAPIKLTHTTKQGPVDQVDENTTIVVTPFQNKEGEASGTWGYNILFNSNPYITQPSIPSLPGNKGFSTEEKARKAGEFVAYKIKHNIMPPSVSKAELDSLGVLR